MDINAFVKDWLAAANAFDTDKWLAFFQKEATLDDPSVGSKFEGHVGIRQYFEDYFIGYNTQTELVKLEVKADTEVHLQLDFTGDFPGRKIVGTFDLKFRNNRIAFARAALI
ncbi:MAG: nuclear transport factor 2 family protein [Chitinophagaceae bacterium]